MRQKFQDRLVDVGILVEENIFSIRIVRFFVGENKVFSLYGDEIQKSYEVGKKLVVVYGKFIFNIESFFFFLNLKINIFFIFVIL